MRRSARIGFALAAAAFALGGTALAGMSAGAATANGTGAPTPVSAPAGVKQMCGTQKSAPKYKHIVVILEENRAYKQVIGSSEAPYINSLVKLCGLATNYHNATHPSLPNYIALTDGMSVQQLAPYLTDCTPSLTCEVPAKVNNIFHELEGHGGWKGYNESMPSNCYKANTSIYAPRHNPAVYYLDLKTSCSRFDVPLGTAADSALLKDFSRQATAPAFSFVTPNLIDDMHNGTTAQGDSWLKTWLPLITKTPVYQSGNTAIFITWDEGEPSLIGAKCEYSSAVGCRVPLIVVAPSVRGGLRSTTSFSHYSLLKTAEQLLGVPQLGLARTAKSLILAFNL